MNSNYSKDLRLLAARARKVGSIDAWKRLGGRANTRLNQFLANKGFSQAARIHLAVTSRVAGSSFGEVYALTLTQAKQYRMAFGLVKRFAAEKPSDIKLQQWAARLATVLGERETAAAAWTAVKAIGPAYMADEYDARIALAGAQGAASGPKIALIGNCQVYPLARYLRLLTGATVHAIAPRDFVDPVLASLAVEEIRGFDHIVTQPVSKGWGALATNSLKQVRPDLGLMPSLVFNGFQPDLLPISAERWAGPKHTFTEFHSLLAMAAFLRGFSAERAADLYNTYVFAKLGYFSEYDTGKRYLIEEAASMGYDISGDMRAWEAHGVFFHTFNHPAVPVLWTMAKQIAAKLDLAVDESLPLPESYFREKVWPLYPELAKRLNLAGSYMFEPPREAAVDLAGLLQQDFAAYAATDFEKMDVKRVREVAATLESIGARP